MKAMLHRISLATLGLQFVSICIIGLMLIRVSPSQIKTGIAGVMIGHQDTPLRISGHDLNCSEQLSQNDSLIHCSTNLQGKPLSLTVQYATPLKTALATCDAEYNQQALGCYATFTYTPRALPYIVIEEGAGISLEILDKTYKRNVISQLDEKRWKELVLIVSLFLTTNILLVAWSSSKTTFVKRPLVVAGSCIAAFLVLQFASRFYLLMLGFID